MSQPGPFATLIVEGAPAAGGDHLGSFDEICSLAKTLKALFREGAPGGSRLSSKVRIRSIGLLPASRIEMLIPAEEVGAARSVLDAVGSCIGAALNPDDTEATATDRRMAGVLAALLAGSGWASVRIARWEGDWEAQVVVVPSELGPALSAIMPAPPKDD
jgi:hypothetical protein